MRKLITIALIICMVWGLAITSYATATTSDDLSLEKAVSTLSDEFDIKQLKNFYEQNGAVVYENLKIINDKKITYTMKWQNI